MSPVATTQPRDALVSLQGIEVPESSVQPEIFFKETRRHTALDSAKSPSLALGPASGPAGDVFELRKSDILSRILVRFSGTLTLTPGTGTIASTARWPYDLLNFRFSANGSSNLIKVEGGLKLKVRDYMKRGDYNDRGVSQTFGGASITQGTLSSPCESWGVGSNTTALAAGSYPVELEWIVPVAEDEVDLLGAVFLATSTADLTLAVDYMLSQCFTLTGNATLTLAGTLQAICTKFSIPVVNGQIIVPDLSHFHSIIQSRTTSVANGDNEYRIIGQGGAKSLLRAYYQTWNGAGNAAVPLKMNATNYGKQLWAYGTSENPDVFIDGQHMREENERQYGTDIGGTWGFGCHEFASELAFRDVVDMSTTGDLRLVSGIASGVSLTNPAVEYVTETVYRAGQAA